MNSSQHPQTPRPSLRWHIATTNLFSAAGAEDVKFKHAQIELESWLKGKYSLSDDFRRKFTAFISKDPINMSERVRKLKDEPKELLRSLNAYFTFCKDILPHTTFQKNLKDIDIFIHKIKNADPTIEQGAFHEALDNPKLDISSLNSISDEINNHIIQLIETCPTMEEDIQEHLQL